MANNKSDRESGAQTGGCRSSRAASPLWASGALALACLAVLAVPEGDAAVTPSKMDLMHLQVFAKQSIRSERSDYEGPVAAGGDVDLSDFEVLGDLTSGGRVSFHRGQVHGSVNAANPQLNQVFSSGVGPVPGLATELASTKLDLLSARLSSLPTTSHFETGMGDDGKLELRATAYHNPEVIDLQASQLATDNGEVRLALNGDHDAALLVRVHGQSVHMRRVGFSATGGLTPSRIIYYFPEATDLEIATSGGAVGANGTPWNIPGSIIAPNAALNFVASTVTGQVFARSIFSNPGAAGGQVDRFEAESPAEGAPGGSTESGFRPSQLLQTVAGDDFGVRFQATSTAPTGLQVKLPAGCRMVCSYHAAVTIPSGSP